MKKFSVYILPAIMIVVVAVLAFAWEGGMTMAAQKRPIPDMDLNRNVSFETATFSLG